MSIIHIKEVRMGKRIRAFLLGFSMLISVLNPSIVYAEEPPVDETPIEVIDEGEPVEVTEEPATGEETGEEPEILPEESSEPEIITEPEETVAPEATPVPEDEIIPEETEEPAEPEEEPEEEPVEETDEDAVLFEAPEGFAVNESDAAGKAALHQMNILHDFSGMEEGKDYAARELVFLTDDRAYAEQVAEIYHAELTSFGHGVAVITITDPEISVEDVFKASLDSDFELPLVEPNYITYLDPIEEKPSPVIEDDSELFSDSLPEVKGWSEWVNDTFGPDADEALKTPSDENFQWQHTMINTYAGWNATMGQGVTVAVIDQGINTSHEDFDGRVTVENVTGDNTWTGHGNHVAGIIGASAENSKGGAGIAPAVNILGINVFNLDQFGKITASNADIMAGLNIAIDHNVDIVNMSLGGYGYSANYEKVIQDAVDAGIVICAAAGNENSNSRPYPAGYKNVISVAAVNRNGAKAGYSNYGSWVTIAAPGSGIYSVYSQDYYSDQDGWKSNNTYQKMDGTSMACPVVSGALALYMSKFGHKNYNDIIKVLKTSTTKSSSSGMGYGIISVEKLFNKKETAPAIEVFDQYDRPVTDFKNPLAAGSYIYLNISEDESRELGKNETILYTTDGKNPAVKNGQIVNGTVYNGYPILVDDFTIGSTITLKAVIVNELSVAGNIKTLKFKTPAIIPAAVKVKTVAFETKKATLKYSSESDPEPYKIVIKTLKDTQGIDKDILQYEHTWTSSNEKVATVDGYGNVTATGPGTAKITLKLLDGSKKSAVCTVTVNQLPENIIIKGQGGIATGTSATFSATVLPAKTKNKKVTWSLVGNAPDGVTLKGAKVTVSKAVLPGTEFTLKATSVEDPSKSDDITVTVVKKASSIHLDTTYNPENDRIKRNSKGVLTTVNLFTTDINDSYNPEDDTAFQLTASLPKGENNIQPVFTSSNPKVATVTSDGYVQAVGKGTAKITATANDGSKKKATVTVKVTVPISRLDIDLGENYYLSLGKSLNLKDKAMFGTQYGTPTTKKVNWYITSVFDDFNNDLTEEALKKGYIKISGNSKLTVSNKVTSLSSFEALPLRVELGARSLDGTGYTASKEILIIPKLEVMFIQDPMGGGYRVNKGGPDQEGTDTVSYCYHSYVYCSLPINCSVTSSNPNVCGAELEYLGYDEISITHKWRNYNDLPGYWYNLWFYTYPNKKGTAKLTVKAMDGSGKSSSVKVKVE